MAAGQVHSLKSNLISNLASKCWTVRYSDWTNPRRRRLPDEIFTNVSAMYECRRLKILGGKNGRAQSTISEQSVGDGDTKCQMEIDDRRGVERATLGA